LIRSTFLLLVALTFALSGCGKGSSAKYDQDGPVADGDTLIESSLSDAKTLSPITLSEAVGGDIVNFVFDGLTRYNERFELVPSLAVTWTVSPDERTITYQLRKGVKFHDGVEFTADDVVFTYKCYVDPKVNTPHGADYRDIVDIRALDKYRVRVTYAKPFAPALANFGAIVPKHLLAGKDINKDGFNRAPVGTGPYKFVEWKTSERFILEANPDYWGGKPHIGRIVIKIIPDQGTEFLALLKGEIDAMGAWTSGGMSAEQFIRQSDTKKFTDYHHKFKAESLSYSYIGWNARRPMFQSKRVRQALTMAIDRQAIIDNVSYGMSRVCNGPFPANSWAGNPEVKPLPYDLEKAKAQFESEGWKDTDGDGLLDKDLDGDGKRDPFKFSIIVPQGSTTGQKMLVIVQQQLKKAGIEIEIKVLEWTTFLTQHFYKGNFDGAALAWSLTPDPDQYAIWHSSQIGEHQFNRVRYSNPEVDRLLEAGVRTLDKGKRAAIYHRIHKLIYDDQPYTFMTMPYTLPAVHKRFKGYQPLALWEPSLLHLQDWYVPVAQQKRLQMPE